MQLILDFGNTLQKAGVFDGDQLIRLERQPAFTIDRLRHLISAHPGISACILSSVIHHEPEINLFLRSEFHFIELDHTTPLPVKNLYVTRETLGKDRLAAAVAGAAMYPGENVLVASAGTALTFDFINRQGEYLGGSIAPGMEMRFRALHTFTGKLPLISYREETMLIGRDTETSILSGVVNGIAAEIEGVASRYLADFDGLKIILTGGDMDYLVKRLKISIFAHPNMVIHGLQEILNFNVDKAR